MNDPIKSNNNQPDWDNLFMDSLVGQEKKKRHGMERRGGQGGKFPLLDNSPHTTFRCALVTNGINDLLIKIYKKYIIIIIHDSKHKRDLHHLFKDG